MDFLKKNVSSIDEHFDQTLFDLLAVGDLAASCLLCQSYVEDKASAATFFNHAVCLFRLQEWEKCLAKLNKGERLLGNVADLGVQEKTTIKKMFAIMGADAVFLPLHFKSIETNPQYARIRIKWLTALCLKKVGREQEALPIARMLAQQYEINL